MYRDSTVDKAVLLPLLRICLIDPEGEKSDELFIVLSSQKDTPAVVVECEDEEETHLARQRRDFFDGERDSSFPRRTTPEETSAQTHGSAFLQV